MRPVPEAGGCAAPDTGERAPGMHAGAEPRDGLRKAFEEMFNQYRERVYRIAYGWCFDVQTALDLTQDVFVKAFGSFEKFRMESSQWTWLCRIAINRCLDFARRRGRRKEVLVGEPDGQPSPARQAARSDPAGELELAELKRALTDSVQKLPPEARAAFILRFFDNLSYREMGRVLDCSIGTVMSRLFYARQRLRSLLESYL